MTDFTVITTVTVPAQDVADLMVSAIEGGSNYWLERVVPVYRNHTDYSTAESYGPDMISRTFYAEDDSEPYVLGIVEIRRGLDLMPTVAGGRHWQAFLQEDADAETGDVFLQLCLFGDIVYG